MNFREKLYKMHKNPEINEFFYDVRDNSRRNVQEIKGNLIILSENISFHCNIPNPYIRAYK